MNIPSLPGILSAEQVRATGERVAELQCPDGLIPWFDGHHADVWDHVEAAMALEIAGLHGEARRAYEWSASRQADDGTWPMQLRADDVLDAGADTNQCAYIAVGVWHDWLAHRDRRFLDLLWPSVRAATEFAVEMQRGDGAISWSRGAGGEVADEALLTGSSCLVLSLRCALALAGVVGEPHPDWERALTRLAHAVAVHPDAFADKRRYAMDWYYPVLGGAVRGPAAHALIAERWGEFVVPGRGVRCVADRPWITAAETCELVLTLVATGDRHRAAELLRAVQFLRTPEGGYWTGWVEPDDAIWPREQTAWTAAAVLLAASALTGTLPGYGLVTGAGLPGPIDLAECDRSCATMLDVA